MFPARVSTMSIVIEAQEFALFQTNYHGDLKTYQWTNIPLALMGRVDKKDGTTVQISLGNEPGEPIFILPDLSPHVNRDLRERKTTKRPGVSTTPVPGRPTLWIS